MRILNNEQVAQLLPMDLCIQACEEASAALLSGQLISRPPSTLVMPKTQPGGVPGLYRLRTMDGMSRAHHVALVRLLSDNLAFEHSGGVLRREKIASAAGGRFVGLVLLLDTDTGELVSIFPDAEIQRRRVGAVGATAAKYAARPASRVLGLLGSGWQAGAAAMAHCAALPIQEIKVYSPTREHRERFCHDMAVRLGRTVRAVETAEEAVRGSDVVACMTNAVEPVIRSAWLEPGMHITVVMDFELEEAGYARCDVIVRGSPRAGRDPQDDTKDLIKHTYVMGGERLEETTGLHFRSVGLRASRARQVDLAELVTGQVVARLNDEEVSVFAVTDAGHLTILGALLWERARACNVGHEVPGEWFSEVEPD